MDNSLTDGDPASSEIARRRSAVAAGRTDWERWSNPEAYETFWSERARAAGALCADFGWVCDIGCGPLQSLRTFLPPHAIYLPADLKSWEPRVLACDLNARLLPEAWLRICDVACLLGVIEYINDPPALFSLLAGRVQAVVISYNCADFAEMDRSGFGWVNALTSGALLSLLEHAGFRIESSARTGDMELLVKAINPRYGIWRDIQRRAARLRQTVI